MPYLRMCNFLSKRPPLKKSAQPVYILLSTILISLAAACAPQIHPAFEANTYIRGMRQHFVNEKLKVHHTTFGDVRYVTERDTLAKQIEGLPLNRVLAYGRTEIAPFYEYYLLAGPRRGRLDLTAYPLVYDTVLHGRRWMFLGKGLKGDTFPIRDFNGITGSLEAGGKDYWSQVSPLPEIVEKYSTSALFWQAYSEIAAYPVKDELEADYQQQMELTYLSMLGDNPRYQEVLGARESPYPLRPEVVSTLREKAVKGKGPVLEALLSRTGGERVVMLNENHFMPWHRMLLTELLPQLRKQGFRYLALEALAGDSLLNAGQAPDLKTGFYAREQYFYRLLRTAQALGFEFVSYEADQGDRETGQARNLYRKTFGKDPDARVVVLAGLAHIYESEGGSRTRMARHFKSLYGIDPLTISQTDLSHYRHELASDLVLISTDSLERERWKRVDLQIVNGLEWAYPSGDFIYTSTYSEPVQLALYDSAGWKSEYGYLGDIPEYSALLMPGASFSAQLPEGTYRLMLFDKEGKAVYSEPVRVAAGG